jgi:hypothetical protein
VPSSVRGGCECALHSRWPAHPQQSGWIVFWCHAIASQAWTHSLRACELLDCLGPLLHASFSAHISGQKHGCMRMMPGLARPPERAQATQKASCGLAPCRALGDDVLPAGLNGDPNGYPIGKGADLFISIWNLHRQGPAPSWPTSYWRHTWLCARIWSCRRLHALFLCGNTGYEIKILGRHVSCCCP